MSTVHLILPDLFLPPAYAAAVSADLVVPTLGKMLARARATELAEASLEAALCAGFDLPAAADAPLAALSAEFDGLAAGCWMRADPVHLHLQRDQMLLSPLSVSADEAAEFCASLNSYFSGQGMVFFAPHPQRWYVRLAALPHMQTTPVSAVTGANVRGALPRGADAARWHQVFNESQMLLHAHPLNQAREARGEMPVNSLWFWGAACSLPDVPRHYDHIRSDEAIAALFAAATRVPYQTLAGGWCVQPSAQLLVCSALRVAMQNGDGLAWQTALHALETHYFQPLWAALRRGELSQLRIDVLAGGNSRCWSLSARDCWRFWRRSQPLARYSLV